MDYETLIRRAATDMDALETLYRALKGDVLAVAYGILRSFPHAEDVVQETFIRLPQAAHRYKGGDGRVFVLRIARYAALESYRAAKRQIPVGELPEQAADAPDPSGGIAVRQALGRLNAAERQVVVLRFYSDLKFGDIARILRCPEGTVKWRCNRALEKLKAYIQE